MNSTTAFRISAGIGFLAVAFGALGAHGPLEVFLRQQSGTELWGKAVLYHLVHAVVLLVLANTGAAQRFQALAWRFFLAGIVLFSGSLYLLALTGIHRLGAITPIGGICLLAGWATLALKR